MFNEKIEIRERCKGVGFDSKTVQRSAVCRSRRELSNEYLLAKVGFDTAENEPCKVALLLAVRFFSRAPPTSSSACAMASSAVRSAVCACVVFCFLKI